VTPFALQSSTSVGLIRRDDGHHAPLAGQKQRIVAEHVADRLDRFPNGHLQLLEMYAQPRRMVDFMTDRGQSPTCRVTHEAQAGEPQQRPRQRQHTRGIGLQITAQPELFAGQHHRNTMIANRAADDQRIAAANLLHAQYGPRQTRADAGGCEVQTAAFAASHHLGVAGDDLHADFFCRACQTGDDAIE